MEKRNISTAPAERPGGWPRSLAQIPINYGGANYDPLFKFGFGLKY